MPDIVWELDGRLLDVLTDLGVELERVEAGAYLVSLHPHGRSTTHVWLIAGEQAVTVEAFVMHVVPGGCDDPAPLHRHLLGRNLRLRGVHYGLDDVGDVFLTGSLPHASVTTPGVDRLLGEVLGLLEQDGDRLRVLAYGERLQDPSLQAKATVHGAGRRPAGTPEWAPHRDARR